MVHIVPSISFVKSLGYQLGQGLSVAQSIEAVFRKESTPLSLQIHLWSRCQQQKGQQMLWEPKTTYQLSLKELLIQGLAGAPIYESLKEIEKEMLSEFDIQWSSYIARLPALLSIPIMFLFFPSFLILLFGPLITHFLSGVL